MCDCVARGAELRNDLDLFLPIRHLVVCVDQPVGVADELQSGSVMVLQPIADVQVEQLGGQQRAAMDALHRPSDGRRMCRVGGQPFTADPDGAHMHTDGCPPTLTVDAMAGAVSAHLVVRVSVLAVVATEVTGRTASFH